MSLPKTPHPAPAQPAPGAVFEPKGPLIPTPNPTEVFEPAPGLSPVRAEEHPVPRQAKIRTAHPYPLAIPGIRASLPPGIEITVVVDPWIEAQLRLGTLIEV